ncbi:MAG: hypothetical protein HND47_10105 [Chloroflexi bacterium]|nr:hypothetical protein [Chloroflexota bacterium]
MRRGSLIWGTVLLLLGGLLLADAAGVRLPNGNSLMSLFWPLLLIGFGGWMLLGVFLRGKVETESASIPLEDARTASVSVNHGAGELNLHSGARGTNWRAARSWADWNIKLPAAATTLRSACDPRTILWISPSSASAVNWIGTSLSILPSPPRWT